MHPDVVVALLENDFDEWLRDRQRRRRPVDAEATFHGLYNDFCWWARLHHAPLLRPQTFGALLSALATGAKSANLADFPLLAEETPFREAPIGKGEISCEEWLADELAAGPQAVADIRSAARMAGFSWPTVRHARYSLLSVKSPLTGVWELEMAAQAHLPRHRELAHAE